MQDDFALLRGVVYNENKIGPRTETFFLASDKTLMH